MEIETGFEQLEPLLCKGVEGWVGCNHSNFVVITQEILKRVNLEQDFFVAGCCGEGGMSESCFVN